MRASDVFDRAGYPAHRAACRRDRGYGAQSGSPTDGGAKDVIGEASGVGVAIVIPYFPAQFCRYSSNFLPGTKP